MFEFKLTHYDKYQVIAFKSEHNHDLVPLRCCHYLKSQRKIEPPQIGIINKIHSAGIKQSDIYSYLREEAGGSQHLNFIKCDSNNLIQRTRAEFSKKSDATCPQDYFKQKKKENKHFFYSFRTNEDGEICGVFFCDAKSRRDYGLFGDVVYFDTTFRTNNYNMLCAPIVGVNNHGQTALFGCGLLDGETTDAVGWLFNVFLQAMGGKKPTSIFTDQSKAISNAIEVVFPESHHGLCLWHICQNAAKHLIDVFHTQKSFAPRFRACIYDPETIEEFEQSWDKLLEDYELRGNDWLERLYELRQKWAQVHSHSYFCAGMTTTQRSESINKFLKAYFNKGHIILSEFVGQYSKSMEDRREKELEEGNKTQQTSPNLISGWSVEREAEKIYTRKMFSCFQEEIQRTIGLLLELEKDDGAIRIYKAKDIGELKRIRILTYNHSGQSVSCSCRQFEFNGILCSHALKLFHDLQYKSLPSQYYLKRWNREAT